jgi:hypothetical protein
VTHCLVFLLRLFGAVNDIFCLFQGNIENIANLKQHYGLSKTANEVTILIEAYRTLRDRGPVPASQVVRDLSGKFTFILYDTVSKSTFVAAVSPHSALQSSNHIFFLKLRSMLSPYLFNCCLNCIVVLECRTLMAASPFSGALTLRITSCSPTMLASSRRSVATHLHRFPKVLRLEQHHLSLHLVPRELFSLNSSFLNTTI